MITRLKEIAYFLGVRLPQIIIGKYITKNLVKVHWGRGLNNFGDCLQPDILKYYGLRPVYVSSLEKSDIIMAGSILQLVNNDYDGIIIGTGGDKKQYYFPNANIVGVRGYLTLHNFSQIRDNCIIGDCGVLTKIIYPEKIHKKYKLGIVPHFVDLKNSSITQIKNRFLEEVVIISPLIPSREVVNQIKMCENIISSSLHGLIVADSFGIPSMRWVNRETMPDIEFYDYKFKDYYSSLGVKSDYISINGDESLDKLLSYTSIKPQNKIADQIEKLDKKMKEIASLIKKKYTN